MFSGTQCIASSAAVFDILRSKCIGVTSLTVQGHVTSSDRSHDHLIPRRSFAIGDPLELSLYL